VGKFSGGSRLILRGVTETHNLSYIFHWVVGYDLSLEGPGCPFSGLFFEWMVGGCEIAYVVQKAC
jgi:hypothetical protein